MDATKWIGPVITLLIALLAFISGYGALKNKIDGLPETYVTRSEWLDGFIEWWPFRTSTETRLKQLEGNIIRLNPDAPRYSRIDADRYQDRREKIVDSRFRDIENQLKDIYERLHECEKNQPYSGAGYAGLVRAPLD